MLLGNRVGIGHDLSAERVHGVPEFVIDDHVPLLVGDDGWGERGRAFATEYLQGLLRAVQTFIR